MEDNCYTKKKLELLDKHICNKLLLDELKGPYRSDILIDIMKADINFMIFAIKSFRTQLIINKGIDQNAISLQKIALSLSDHQLNRYRKLYRISCNEVMISKCGKTKTALKTYYDHIEKQVDYGKQIISSTQAIGESHFNQHFYEVLVWLSHSIYKQECIANADLVIKHLQQKNYEDQRFHSFLRNNTYKAIESCKNTDLEGYLTSSREILAGPDSNIKTHGEILLKSQSVFFSDKYDHTQISLAKPYYTQ
ncbi:hypothetical protein LRP52_29195 [Photobacterium sp. ZSDE20]|uniref:HEPN AbiU2-like domain-containing protein n=1 Tax=Photobacterium pectinilyticum TaxID=2906793 RepID=A0ABT1N8V9_9GAMM|nr:hypothetical protein [Photobacterium sp. ZSDE20]MCQ1060269.1 hypothetical protein [Photobacterium sp. ZSDE20]MDD1826256.1 hypothetical protein [Photobacterium sp. ZSDE20]